MRLIAFMLTLCFLAPSCSKTPNDGTGAEAALRALDAAYVDGWKQDGTAAQEKAVMALFAKDAVIMPGAGLEPREGADALRRFWFPADAPPTVVARFEHDITGVETDGALGVVRGRYRLDFEYDGAVYAREGNYQFAARRQTGGAWLISQMIWNDRTVDQ